MPLDYTSLLIALAFAGACLAVTMFAAWLSARTEGFLLTWAIGAALIVAHVLVYSVYVHEPRPVLAVLAFSLLTFGLTMIYAAAVQFRTRGFQIGSTVVVALAAQIVALAGFATSMDGVGFILANVVAAALLFATAWQYALVRQEAPGATLGLIILYSIVAVSFLLCATVLIANGSWVLGRAPDTWAENVNLAAAIGGIAGVGALSLALNQARIALSHRRDAETDMLTGLLNRRALFEKYDDQDLPPFTSVVVFDLDDFKAINDAHGHAVGDEVLRRFAATLRAGVRNIDTIARLGGEEFAVVLPRSGSETSVQVAERIRAAFANIVVDTDDGSVRCTVSAGVAATAAERRPFADVLRSADEALYSAKRSGRDKVVVEPFRLVG
jgi:diguanylate cyclase (GGDEF)-like protein